MEALNPEIKSEQVQQPELLEPNGNGAALPPLLLRNVQPQLRLLQSAARFSLDLDGLCSTQRGLPG